MTKRCTLVGLGMGSLAELTPRAKEAIMQAPLVAGARRMLESVSPLVHGATFEGYAAKQLAAAFNDYAACGEPCAVFSGDTGFYSGAASLYTLLCAEGWTVTVCAALSSPQALAARLGKSWQSWHLVSAHGTDCDLGMALSPLNGESVFFLTGGSVLPHTIAAYLCSHGLQAAQLTVATRLSYSDETLWQGTAAEYVAANGALPAASDENPAVVGALSAASAPPLACVLVERTLPSLAFGSLDDSFFMRSSAFSDADASGAAASSAGRLVPMTKRFVRAAALILLSLTDGSIVWDVGAGTGAVTVDIARAVRCHVYAVEQREDACALVTANCARAGCANVDVVHGSAPEALAALPAPSAVFVGGTSGALRDTIRAVQQKNAAARIVIAAVTLETLSACALLCQEAALSCSVMQLSVTEGRPLANYQLFQAQNPVWLVTLTASQS